jgi:hypothetical protein
MRTKTLLLTAVLGVAGVAAPTAQAQSVYSLNAVGYVNLSLGAGFTIISNPLNNTTNDIQTILTGMPNNTVVYGFNPTTQAYLPSTFRTATGKWTVDLVMNPGAGVFISLPSAATVTFVGNVPQGTLVNTIPPGFSIQAYPIPVSTAITNTALISFPTPNNNDIIYAFSNASGSYVPHTYRTATGQYTGATYVPAVGEGFFYLSTATAAKTWTVNFSVN